MLALNRIYKKSGHIPILHQSEAAECGLACLAMVCSYHGYKTDLTSLRRRFPVSLKGATLQNLMAVADQLGMAARPLRAELGSLGTIETPAILHWDMRHFVVLAGAGRRHMIIHDPALFSGPLIRSQFNCVLCFWQEASKA